MKRSNCKRVGWLASVVLGLWATTSQAATVSLSPLNQNVVIGDSISLQLNMDFSDGPTIGGGIDIFYDSSRLSFASFTFSPSLGDDVGLQRQPDVLTNTLNGLAFGNFNGLSGPSMVGTLTFNTIGMGTALFTMADNVLPAGGFFSSATFAPQTVTYQGTSVNITAVPIPAALWLMLSGMASFGFLFHGKRRI